MQVNRVEGYSNKNNQTSFGTKLNIFNNGTFKLSKAQLGHIEDAFERQTSRFSGSLEVADVVEEPFPILRFVYRNDKHRDFIEGFSVPESETSVNLLEKLKQIHKTFRNREKNLAQIRKNIDKFYSQTGEDTSKIKHFQVYDLFSFKDLVGM